MLESIILNVIEPKKKNIYIYIHIYIYIYIYVYVCVWSTLNNLISIYKLQANTIVLGLIFYGGKK